LKKTLKQIADLVGGEVLGDKGVLIKGISSLALAGDGEISFFRGSGFKDQIKATKASALIVREAIDTYKGAQIVVRDPYLAYARVAALFSPPVPRFEGISEKAIIEKDVKIGEDVSIYPLVYIGYESVIGSKVTIFPGVYIGNRVKIGDGTVVYPNVTIMSDCIIGKDVTVHGGTVIGSDGFGYARDGDVNVKIPQVGIVEIEDDVEIGANNTIDRAAIGKTVIRSGVKTDNLVQIGHNVVVGENTLVVAQVGIAGSTKIGKNVIIGGQVGFADHVEIGDRVMIGAKSGVSHSIPAGEIVSGIPTMPHRLWLKTRGNIKKLPLYLERIKTLENKVKHLETKINEEKKE